mgnify:CR=1 FL=1
MINDFKINNTFIGQSHTPFIIAEISGNHNQSLNRALEIIDAASDAGAHAVKIQTYTADTMTLDIKDKEFFIKDKNSLWYGKSLYELYKIAYTPWEWHEEIFDYANKLGLICFITPFDETAIDFLENLNVPAYKIASFENSHIKLIQKAASTGKPLIISTGMATLSEIEEITNIVRDAGCENFILLKCTSTYPASPENSNVLTIPNMQKVFNCQIGLSDHTLGIGASLAAVSHGATVIEKHFTLLRSDGGVDSEFSMEPNEMKQLVRETKVAWQSLGTIKYGPRKAEKSSKIYRRSLYVSKDIKQGEKFNNQNLRIIRPGLGLPPKYYDIFIGKKVNCDVKKGTPVSFDLIG